MELRCAEVFGRFDDAAIHFGKRGINMLHSCKIKMSEVMAMIFKLLIDKNCNEEVTATVHLSLIHILPKLIGFLKRQETNGKFFSKEEMEKMASDPKYYAEKMHSICLLYTSILQIGKPVVILPRKNECNLCYNLFFLNHLDKCHQRKADRRRLVNCLLYTSRCV